MPIYEYRCNDCEEIFEIFYQSRNEQIDVICPKCSSPDASRVLSVFGGKIRNTTSSSSGCSSCASSSCSTCGR